MRYIGPKARICRREKLNVFGSDKLQKTMQRRPSRLGMHAQKRPGKLSEFGKQLREKQKIRFMFGITETQLKNYLRTAQAMKGIVGDEFMKLLERRLDNAVYRSGLAISRPQARQMVSHGIFTVNGRRVDVPSYQVRAGDVIEVRTSRKGIHIFNVLKSQNESIVSAPWMTLDLHKLAITIDSLPAADHTEQSLDPAPLIEFYSR